MSREEKQKPFTAYNFKKLYNKQYGDIATLGKQHRYTPEQVFNLAVKYFEWAESNALKAAESSSFRGRTYQDEVNKPRVFTFNGLRLFCGWSRCAMEKWKKEPGFSEVMEFIESVIYEQKFQLAANGVINAAFIAKDTGLTSLRKSTLAQTQNQALQSQRLEPMKCARRFVISWRRSDYADMGRFNSGAETRH
ncbi:terminase small subunit [Enterobacter phage N5822]|nr:terminase small subunit [Enterobacter phage N5822]